MTNVSKKKSVIHFVITDVFSGAESVSAHIIKDLPGDWEGYYVAPKGAGTDAARNMGLNVIECNTSSVSEIKRVVKEISPDAIHAHDCRMSFLCAVSGFDFVSQLHANWDWMKKRSLKSIMLKYTCKRAKATVCVSKSIRDDFIYSDVLKKRAVVLENTVDRDELESRAGDGVGREYDLCFVGRLTGLKEPLRFVELVSLIQKKKPDVRCVMVGDGDLKERVEEKLRELDLCESIDLVGYDKNPYKYMKSSKIGVLTSSVEGFGLVAVEEMVFGLPVLAFPVGGLVDIVTDGAGFLGNSIEELCEEAISLLTDKEYYNKKSESALKRSEEYTDRRKYIERITEIYEHR